MKKPSMGIVNILNSNFSKSWYHTTSFSILIPVISPLLINIKGEMLTNEIVIV